LPDCPTWLSGFLIGSRCPASCSVVTSPQPAGLGPTSYARRPSRSKRSCAGRANSFQTRDRKHGLASASHSFVRGPDLKIGKRLPIRPSCYGSNVTSGKWETTRKYANSLGSIPQENTAKSLPMISTKASAVNGPQPPDRHQALRLRTLFYFLLDGLTQLGDGRLESIQRLQ